MFLNYYILCPSYYGSECPVWGRSDAGSWWDWLVVVFCGGFAVEGSMCRLPLMCFRHGVDVVMVV